MTRNRHRHWSPSFVPYVASIAAWIFGVVMVNPAAAQSPEWRKVESPYQEDVEYSAGERFAPMVEVDMIRWRAFSIERSDLGPAEDTESVGAELVLEFENRSTKSGKVLVILLLEDENGSPLERIEAKPFKLAGGRLKERKETVKLLAGDLKATRKVYLFFEVMR